MLRLCLSFAVVLVACAACALGVIRAQPPGESPLDAVLNAPGCPPAAASSTAQARPCWLGIVIGLTGRQDARELLSAHPWVGEIFEDDAALSWRWSGRQPAAIDASQNGLISFGSGGGSTVRQMRILTHIPYGDVWLRLGPPESALLIRPVSQSSAYQIGFYTAPAAQAISRVGCPARPTALWFSATAFGRGELWTTEQINSVQFNIYGTGGWWPRLRRCTP